MSAFWQAFLILFLAEMGDKTQIVSFSFGARYPLPVVLFGIFAAVAALMAVCMGVGSVAGMYIPQLWMNLASGVLFIVFGLLTLRPEVEKEAEESAVKPSKLGPLLTVMVTFFLAELGDKTIFAAVAIAGKTHQPLLVWLGSTLGMFLADLVGVVCGRVLGKQLPQKALQWGSAAVLVAAGAYTLWDAVSHGGSG